MPHSFTKSPGKQTDRIQVVMLNITPDCRRYCAFKLCTSYKQRKRNDKFATGKYENESRAQIAHLVLADTQKPNRKTQRAIFGDKPVYKIYVYTVLRILSAIGFNIFSVIVLPQEHR